MNLTVLSEMRAMEGFGSEHGLSFLIEADRKKILFDTGSSDLFLQSADRLSLDLEEVDRIVLSHGHWDHGNGLAWMKGKPLICHPGCFVKRYRKSGGEYLGLSLSREETAVNAGIVTGVTVQAMPGSQAYS